MRTFAKLLGVSFAVVLSGTAAHAVESDLSVVKTGPATVVAGTEIVYQVTVHNAGPDPATNVTVTDTYSTPPDGEGAGGGDAASCSNGIDDDADNLEDLDDLAAGTDTECEGVIFLGSTGGCTISGSTVDQATLDCPVGALAVGETRTFTVKYFVTPGYLAKKSLFVTNSASVTASEDDLAQNDNLSTVETAVDEVADLRVTKSVEPVGSILAGDTFWYTIWVDNFGPSAARNVQIIDTLLSSDKVSVLSCAFSVSQSGGEITQFTCSTGDHVQTQFGTDIGKFKTNIVYPLSGANQGRVRASFRLTAKTDLDVTNSTIVGSDTFDPDTDNNYADVNIDVLPVADLDANSEFALELQVAGQHGKAVDTENALPAFPEAPNYTGGGIQVTAGRRGRIRLTASNPDGPSPATNVVIEFLLPAGTSILYNSLNPQADPPADPTEGPQGRCYTDPAGEPRRRAYCVYDSIAEDESASAELQFLVDPTVPDGTQLSVDGLVHGDEFDPDLGNNSRSIQFTVRAAADLQLDKFSYTLPVAGKDVSYSITVANHGPSVSRDVTLRDQLPAGTTFVSAYLDAEGLPPVVLPCGMNTAINRLYCSLGDIPPTGDSPMYMIVNLHVDPSVPAGTILTNTADVYLKDTVDPFSDDNTDSDEAEVSTEADLGIVKTADADIYSPSSRVTFTLTATNEGPSDAQDVQMIDDLPPTKGAIYLFDSGNCLLSGTTLTCPVGTLAPGESRSVNVYMLIKGNKGRVTNNASSSTSTNDPNPDNDSAFKTVLVKGGTKGGGGK